MASIRFTRIITNEDALKQCFKTDPSLSTLLLSNPVLAKSNHISLNVNPVTGNKSSISGKKVNLTFEETKSPRVAECIKNTIYVNRNAYHSISNFNKWLFFTYTL